MKRRVEKKWNKRLDKLELAFDKACDALDYGPEDYNVDDTRDMIRARDKLGKMYAFLGLHKDAWGRYE